MDYQRIYQYRFRDVDQRKRAAIWAPIACFIYEQLGRPEKILDPAAGRCEFLNAVPSAERWGIDMSDYEEASAREGTHFVIADVMEAELPTSHFDAIFVSNFLEHLPDQEAIAAFLGRMRECLQPGGRIGVMGPNIRYCHDSYWDCADHQIALTHLAVEEHLYGAGLQPHTTYDRFLPFSFRGGLPQSPRLTSAYLRFRPAWRVLGKQFLVVAER